MVGAKHCNTPPFASLFVCCCFFLRKAKESYKMIFLGYLTPSNDNLINLLQRDRDQHMMIVKFIPLCRHYLRELCQTGDKIQWMG